jgi:hypothetical protein
VKTFSAAAITEIANGTAVVSGAVEIACSPPIRIWGGFGTITVSGQPYEGIGDRGIAQASAASLGGAEQNVTLELSGVEAKAVAVLDAAQVQGAPVTVYRLIFKGDAKTLVGSNVFTRGRLDQLPLEDEIGATATIKALIESAARGLGRRGGRMRTDTDQRLVASADGFYKNVSYAGQKNLAWGGRKSAAASSVLPGTDAGFGGGYGGGGGSRFDMSANLV